MQLDQQDVDRELAELKKQATALLARIDDELLNRIHGVINKMPGAVAVACLSAALANCISHISKTEDGVGRNVLIASEAILKMAIAGLAKKNEEQKLN